MVRRLLLLSLVLLCATSGVDAQFRLRRKTPPSSNTAPTLRITSPAATSTFQTTASSVALAGTAVDDRGVVSVAWTCPTCTPTSGTMVGTSTWDSGSVASVLTVVSDQFSVGTNTALAAHVPSPIGTSWAEVVDSLGTLQFTAGSGTGTLAASATGAAGSTLIYVATPSTPIIGANYDVSVKLGSAYTGATASSSLIFGYTDTSNYCFAQWWGSSLTNNLKINKRVAGVVSTLATGSHIAPVPNDVIKVSVRGTGLTVSLNAVSVATATDTFCDNASGVGIGAGAVSDGVNDYIKVSNTYDDFTVVDQDGSSAGIGLASGSNVITVTATDTNAATAVSTLTVTRAASDTAAPVVEITVPTVSTTYTSSGASIALGGTCTDNIACTGVTWTCATCTPASGTASLSSGAWAASAIGLGSGSNTMVVTGTDAVALTASDTITVSYTAADVTPPTVTITTNSGSNYSTGATPTALAGTASDNVTLPAGSVVLSCSTCSPTTVNATGTTNWSASLNLAQGANTITATVTDSSTLTGTDAITVTYAPTLTIQTTSLASMRVGQTYSNSPCLTAVNGVTPYTWSKVSGTYPAGISFAGATGCFSGTPTGVESQALTMRVTDAATVTDDQALTLAVIDPAAEGPNDYYTTLIARGDHFTHLSLRSQTEILQYDDKNNPAALGYDFTGDTNPEKVDGVKFVVPQWLPIATNVKVQIEPADTTIALNQASSSGLSNGVAIYIDTEVLVVSRPSLSVPITNIATGSPTVITTGQIHPFVTGDIVNLNNVTANTPAFAKNLVVTVIDSTHFSVAVNTTVAGTGGNVSWGWNPDKILVTRGAYSTTAAVHTVGTTLQVTNNSLQNQLRFPLGPALVPGTYLFTWDYDFTTSWLGSMGGLSNYKAFQVADGNGEGLWMEPNTHFGGGRVTSGSTAGHCTGWDPTIHFAAAETRIYNTTGGVADWTQTNTSQAGPGVTKTEPLAPMLQSLCLFPSRWIRVWYYLDTRLQDYDYLTVWVADEQRDPVKTIDNLPISIRPGTTGEQITIWRIEMNTSTPFVTRQSSDPALNFRDFVGYVRNFVVLQNPPVDWSALRVKPVR